MEDKSNTRNSDTGSDTPKTPNISFVLRKLLKDNGIRPIELSTVLNMPNQTIHQLLHKHEIYPKISTLLPIAKFFKITIGQLIGAEPLEKDKEAEDEADAH